MEKFICIHAHFYQPPRENPWLEAIEEQTSAYPYHDWNERITAECYAPNGAARIMDERGLIVRIVNNYSKISFNFGPTLLSWMEAQYPDVYRSILQADRLSRQNFSGHGSAMAQAYNHIILPLATSRDKETQVLWGIADFERRFGRKPEGMWLAETAVDTETLEILARHGIKFTVLSPYQAGKIKKLSGGKWKDVTGGKVDPTCAYQANLPSGNSIALFFYDGPISRAVAFEKLLNSGELFAERMMSGFHHEREWAQLMHIATDGESYGHHHQHGEMALAYALRSIEEKGEARLTNYGEYLEMHPPQHEAQVIEASAWSCSHGVERWNSDCGCNTGGNAYHQKWRHPLRAALDWLRDEVALLCEEQAQHLFREGDLWAARNAYSEVIVDRSPANLERFFVKYGAEHLRYEEKVRALKLLEVQRHAMLMFTSCGWFFDELSGIETVKVIEFAGRVIQLSQDLFGEEVAELENNFLERLASAPSNLDDQGNGADIYRRYVKPAIAGLKEMAAHYAISSLFARSADEIATYSYDVERRDFEVMQAGKARVAVGQAEFCSRVTMDRDMLTFAVLHFGDHNISAGVRHFQNDKEYAALVREVREAFSRADLTEVIRILSKNFPNSSYSIRSLFGDDRRRITEQLLSSTLREAELSYRQIYDNHAPLMSFLGSMGIERPRILSVTADFVINANLRRELSRELDTDRVKALLDSARADQVTLDKPGLGFSLQVRLEQLMRQLVQSPGDMALLEKAKSAVQLAVSIGLPVNLWQAQNSYVEVAASPAQHGAVWEHQLAELGRLMHISPEHFQPQAKSTMQIAS